MCFFIHNPLPPMSKALDSPKAVPLSETQPRSQNATHTGAKTKLRRIIIYERVIRGTPYWGTRFKG